MSVAHSFVDMTGNCSKGSVDCRFWLSGEADVVGVALSNEHQLTVLHRKSSVREEADPVLEPAEHRSEHARSATVQVRFREVAASVNTKRGDAIDATSATIHSSWECIKSRSWITS